MFFNSGKASKYLAQEIKDQSLDFSVDFGGDIDKVVEYVQEQGIEYVISASEPSVGFVEEVRIKANLEYRNEDSLNLARFHKGHMLDALKNQGVEILDFVWGSKIEDFDDFLSNYDFDTKTLILKPALGAASIGVHHVKTEKEARATLDEIFSDEVNYLGHKIEDVVAQEYFKGNEFVLDTYSFGGKHVLSHSNSYKKHASTRGTFVYDNIAWINADEEIVQRLYDYSLEVLKALGVKNGCSHIEYLVDGDTIQFVELNFRPHGANNIPFIHHLTGGASQVWQEVEWITEGKKPAPEYSLKFHGTLVLTSLDDPMKFEEYDTEDIISSDDPRLWKRHHRIEIGVHYPETIDLDDTMALGAFWISAEDQHDVDECEIEIQKNFNAIVHHNNNL